TPAQLRKPAEGGVEHNMCITRLAEGVARKRLPVPEMRGFGQVAGLVYVRGRPGAVKEKDGEYQSNLRKRAPAGQHRLVVLIGDGRWICHVWAFCLVHSAFVSRSCQ